MPQDSSIADFARMGALATDDPSYQQVADSPTWKNMVRGWSASVDEAIQSGPVDNWTADAFGAVGDLFGVTPEASRAAGRELPRQVLNFIPAVVGTAAGFATAGPPGAAIGGKLGLGLTSGLSAFDAYGKSGNFSDAALAAAAPYVGGKLSEIGSKAVLRNAATPGSFLNRMGFMEGANALAPATHTITDAVTGASKQVLGETVSTIKDKALGYLAGETLANVGFTGLDIIQQGPDAVFNKDYLFANLASNIPFMAADLPNFTKTRFAWEPTDAPLVPTSAQINAQKTRGEVTKESLDAIDNDLKKFQAEADLGVDVGRFVDKYNRVAAAMDGHRTSVNLATDNFQSTWNQLRTVNGALPEILPGTEPAVLLKDPSVIGFDPAKTAVQDYAKSLKDLKRVMSGTLDRVAKSDADLDQVMGLVENDLKLPETLLSKPVVSRTLEDYQKALGTKLSDNAVKLIRMKHMQVESGKAFTPEFPELWKAYEDAITGKFSGSINDRYELITASLLATGKFPRVVKAQKKAVKQAAKEGLTKAEVSAEVTQTLATTTKADELKTKVAERVAAAEAVVKAAEPKVAKPKMGRPAGPSKKTVDKNATMEERILLASKVVAPTDEDRFFMIASGMIDPAARAKSLNWMHKVATEHAALPLAQKLAKFQSGLNTVEERVALDNKIQTVPLNENITPDAHADIEAAIAENDDNGVPAREEAMRELIVEETAREVDEDDKPEISTPEQDQTLARDYMVALAKKAGVEMPPAAALARLQKMTIGPREKLVGEAKLWKKQGLPELAASGIDPLSLHFTLGEALPIKEFATAWAKEAGVPEAEIPATVQDFVRITQAFAAGESRFGKLEGQTGEGVQFAKAADLFPARPEKYLRTDDPTRFKHAVTAVNKNTGLPTRLIGVNEFDGRGFVFTGKDANNNTFTIRDNELDNTKPWTSLDKNSTADYARLSVERRGTNPQFAQSELQTAILGLKSWLANDVPVELRNAQFTNPDTGIREPFRDVLTDLGTLKTNKDAQNYLQWLIKAQAQNPQLHDTISDLAYNMREPSNFAQGGTVYGAAFKNIAQAFFSTKAFQGPNKTKSMAYVLAHENAHIAFGKALRGEYGPEAKQIFDEAHAWVKGNDPAVLRDVEEVIRDLYLPKEFRKLDGVKDILGNMQSEEWLANAHAMMVTGAINSSKPMKALMILPKVIRDMVENTIRRIQSGLKQARMYWKLSGDPTKMAQVQRVKDMMDSVRSKFRENEWNMAQAHEFLNIDPAGLQSRMDDAQYARSVYGADTIKSKIGGFFNNATQGLGDFMATYKSFQEPGLKLLHAERSIKGQVAESLTPIFGRQGATGNIVVDKSLPWFKLANSKPLYNLVKKINLEAQDSDQSVIVQNPDGTISFNWAAMTPESRATVKLYPPESQKAMAQFLIQKEQSTRIAQKNNVGHESAYARAFVGNLIAKMKSFDAASAPETRFTEARVVMGKMFDAVQAGDAVALKDAMGRFDNPAEAQKIVEIVQDRTAKIKDLEKFYAGRPNFQSLRRFKPVIQRYLNTNNESVVLDFSNGTEAAATRKDLEAKGWRAQGDPIIRDLDRKYKNEFTLDSKMVDLLQSKEGKLKDIINSMDLDPIERDALLGESDFTADLLREAKSNDIYLPGVKRRISGGPEHLDMLEQHLTYTQAAHKVGYMKALGEEIKYHMNSPELKDQLREKMQFLEFYNQAKSSDPKFWRMVNKANAVWHIGFNLPGHLAELFQPVQTHIHEAVAQGHSLLGALKATVGAEKSAMAAIGKLMKSKVGYQDSEAIWEHWHDKDEADMLKTNWPRNLQQPLQEVYQQVGVNQETLRAIVEDREMPTPSKVLTKAANMYGNTAMGVYSVFTQHNALVGLLTGYRLAKKKGLSHADAVKQAELFELAVNNSAGKLERPAYFNKLGGAGYMVYALSSYVRGRFSQLARYYRHGFDKVNFPELNQGDRRAARKAFATMLSGQLAAAGILGFPFVGAGIALMEDLTGEELKGSGLNALNEMTEDPLLTQALGYGVVSSVAESLGIPADLHSRFALGGFLGINSYDGVSAASVLGPTASMVNSMWSMGKTLVQEKDLGAAFRAGGPGGVKRMAEALSPEFQAQNPDASLPMTMAGFRSGKMFKAKEMERIISKTNEAAQRDVQIAAKRVEESLMLGPEVAQATLMREANALIPQKLEGKGRQLALKSMMQNLRQRIAMQQVKAQMPSDIRSKATMQTAPVVQDIARAVGYQPPVAGNVQQEDIMRQIYSQLGAQRSPRSMQRAAQRQRELNAEPGTFY